MTIKQRFLDCKSCGRRITLEMYTGNHHVVNRRDEKLTCPRCLEESTYSGDDFKTAEL
jgi:transcription elongation factor Elf1